MAVPFFVLTREDVQLTKDDVPVIYHDFLMSETGIDAPLHSLSLEQVLRSIPSVRSLLWILIFSQFMYISEAQSTPADLPSLAEKRYLERCGEKPVNGYKSRSYSLNAFEQSRAKSLVERMKHTLEFKLNEYKGYDSYKGNIRSEYIQASFMTLEELFVKLPESVRFDIEISECSTSQRPKNRGNHKLSIFLCRISNAL
jgi:glycerophosphodiester phosphodiesterase